MTSQTSIQQNIKHGSMGKLLLRLVSTKYTVKLQLSIHVLTQLGELTVFFSSERESKWGTYIFSRNMCSYSRNKLNQGDA